MNVENVVALTDPRDLKNYPLEPTGLRLFAPRILIPAFSLFGDMQITGLEHLPDSGPVVLACNHLTNFDVFPMSLSLPRPIFFMGKEQLFRSPLVEPLFRALGGFPVYRGLGDGWAMRHAARLLENEQVVGIFPEGTRSKGKGLRAAKTGAARLALDHHCPIVPMGISGTQRMFKHFPRRTPVEMALGAPIYPHPHETPVALTDRTMFAIASLLPPELRGVYAEHPAGF
jgi:1-acyl-sn-glycerol-3-phosphate acyltransferase